MVRVTFVCYHSRVSRSVAKASCEGAPTECLTWSGAILLGRCAATVRSPAVDLSGRFAERRCVGSAMTGSRVGFSVNPPATVATAFDESDSPNRVLSCRPLSYCGDRPRVSAVSENRALGVTQI